VEGECLRVLGDVGRDTVVTNAAVDEGLGVALVVEGGQARDAGLLEADERALRALVAAPDIWHCQLGCLMEDMTNTNLGQTTKRCWDRYGTGSWPGAWPGRQRDQQGPRR
jgi:hypothetical protein